MSANFSSKWAMPLLALLVVLAFGWFLLNKSQSRTDVAKENQPVTPPPSIETEEQVQERNIMPPTPPAVAEQVEQIEQQPSEPEIVEQQQSQEGELGPDGLTERTRAAVNKLIDRSHKGLEAEPAAGGGERVNLKGRFRTVPVATRQPDGSIVVKEYNSPVPKPEPQEQPEEE